MKLLAIFLWCQHYRRLKAKGYSFRSFCETSLAFWQNLTHSQEGSTAENFSRSQFRIRW